MLGNHAQKTPHTLPHPPPGIPTPPHQQHPPYPPTLSMSPHPLNAGLSSLEHVAEHMTSAEERTLGLLSYVNDLHSEVEVLEDNIGQLRSELAWLQGQQQGRQAGRGTLVQVFFFMPMVMFA